MSWYGIEHGSCRDRTAVEPCLVNDMQLLDQWRQSLVRGGVPEANGVYKFICCSAVPPLLVLGHQSRRLAGQPRA